MMKVDGGIDEFVESSLYRTWGVQLTNGVEVFESGSRDFSLLLERTFGWHFVE